MIILGIIALAIGFILSAKALANSDYDIHVVGTAFLGGMITVSGIWCIDSFKSLKL